MSIHHVPTVSYVSLWTQSFVFNVLISCHGWLKATKESSLHRPRNYPKLINSSTRYQNSSDMRDFFEQADYILIMMFSLVRGAPNHILIESKNKFYLH